MTVTSSFHILTPASRFTNFYTGKVFGKGAIGRNQLIKKTNDNMKKSEKKDEKAINRKSLKLFLLSQPKNAKNKRK